MRRLWVVTIALACLALPAHAQCPGDMDNNGSVEISELVRAVNSALYGCGNPTPTPTHVPQRCPFEFTDDTGETGCAITVQFLQHGQACATFPGRWHGDGQTILIEIVSSPAATLVGHPVDAQNANVTGYRIGIDPQVHAVLAAPVRMLDFEQDGVIDGFRLVGAQTWFTVVGCDGPWTTIFMPY